MKDLAERKQLLVAQSQAQRLLIQLEVEQIRSSLRWLQPASQSGQAIRRSGWLLSALAGLLLARRGRSLVQWVVRGLEAWRLVRRLLGR